MDDKLCALHEYLDCHKHESKTIDHADGKREFLFVCECGHIKQRFITDKTVVAVQFNHNGSTLTIDQVMNTPLPIEHVNIKIA